MSTLRSVLIEALRELPDAELGRIVRAATNAQLRPLVQVALDLDDQGERSKVEATAGAPRPRKARQEDAPGPRPTRGRGKGTSRLLELLASGPKSTGELATALGISKSGVRQAAKKLGKLVRSSRSGKGDQVFEAAR